MSWLSEVVADGALGAWLLNETSGTTAADSSGNGHDLTINGSVTLGAATVMPAGSTSFDFPGSGGAYLSANAAAWMAAADFSVQAWVNADSLSSYRAIISRENNANVSRQWSFYATSGKLNMFTSADRLGTATLSASTGYMVTATYDSATSTLKYYVNDTLDATLTSVTIPNAQTASPYDLWVGASRAATGGSNFLFDGRMGPVAYFGSVLSGARIAAHYVAGSSVSGTLATTLGNTTLAASGTVDNPVTGILATTLGDTTLAASGTVLQVYDPDTSNAALGLDLVMVGTVTQTVPVVAPPASKLAANYDKAIAYPTPVMVKGRPT